MTDIDDLDDCPEPWRSEIEQLRKENERLRLCMRMIRDVPDDITMPLQAVKQIAKGALDD